MSTTPNLSLPYVFPGQALKHVTINESLRRLDALIHISVISNDLSVPPTSPKNGDRYLIPPDNSGAWSGQTGDIAAFEHGAWIYITPDPGWIVLSQKHAEVQVWDGLNWMPLSGNNSKKEVEFLGINSVPDSQNRLTVSSSNSLFFTTMGSHRLAISKPTTVDSASIVFQNNFVGRSEIGLTGTDDLQVKMSSDGVHWKDAITIDKATGYIGLNTVPTARLTISEGDVHLGYSVFNGSKHINSPSFELMQNASGHRNAYFDMHACDEWTNYSSRIIRFAGPNSPFKILNRGVGGITIGAEDAGPIKLETQKLTRLFIKSNGRIGVGTTTPSAHLDVNGAVRVGQFKSDNLPDAVSLGEGSIIFVSDAPIGPALRVSDGLNWI